MELPGLETLEEARVNLEGNLGLLAPFDFELSIRVAEIHPIVVTGDDQALHRDTLSGQAQERNQDAQKRK
jgi:hypothetical protein